MQLRLAGDSKLAVSDNVCLSVTTPATCSGCTPPSSTPTSQSVGQAVKKAIQEAGLVDSADIGENKCRGNI